MFKTNSLDSTRRQFVTGAACLVAAPVAAASSAKTLVVDALRNPGISELGTRWSAVTDGVMGGLSEVALDVEQGRHHVYYRMRGTVRTANNGGFVQMALPLATRPESFDASGFDGLRLRVRGNGESYAVHLRTGDSRAPWDYHTASFKADGSWRDVNLLLDDFESSTGSGHLDPRRLQRLAITAIGRDFEADLSVASVAWFGR